MRYKASLVLFVGIYMLLLVVFFISGGMSVHTDSRFLDIIFMLSGGFLGKLLARVYEGLPVLFIAIALEAMAITMAIQLNRKKRGVGSTQGDIRR